MNVGLLNVTKLGKVVVPEYKGVSVIVEPSGAGLLGNANVPVKPTFTVRGPKAAEKVGAPLLLTVMTNGYEGEFTPSEHVTSIVYDPNYPLEVGATEKLEGGVNVTKLGKVKLPKYLGVIVRVYASGSVQVGL